MDYHELSKLTVVKLREMAQEHTDLKGVSGMKKEELVTTLAEKMGIEVPHREVVGLDKGKIKARIKELKKQRDEALAKKDREQLRITRREIHKLRRKLRRAVRIK